MTRTLARQMSGPVPSPSMNGTIGFGGTSTLPLLRVIFAPWAGGVTLGLAAVDMRCSPGESPAAWGHAGAGNASTRQAQHAARTRGRARMRDWRAAQRGRATKERMSYTINKSEGAAKPSLLRQLCAVRPIDPADSSGKSRLKQVLSARALIAIGDRKSTRLNSSHTVISYAVFCLKKKK